MLAKIVRIAVITVFALTVVGVPSGWASDPFTKLGRGFANVLTGWIELPNTVHRTAEGENAFVAWTSGVAHGIGRSLARTGAGFYDMATFLIPVPEHYEPVIEPEYVF